MGWGGGGVTSTQEEQQQMRQRIESTFTEEKRKERLRGRTRAVAFHIYLVRENLAWWVAPTAAIPLPQQLHKYSFSYEVLYKTLTSE